jgi:hypothetical protein
MITLRLPLLLSNDGQFIRQEIVLNCKDQTDILTSLLKYFKLKSNDFYLSKCSETVFQVKLRLLGGKGGFGSQLRAQGNKMSSKKRAGNYESCRTLNGQRIRVQKQTKLIEEYLAKEPERLSKREQEIREKMQKYLEAPDKKVMFSDPEYLKLCRKLIDSTEDAVRSGLRAQNEESDEESSSENDHVNDESLEFDEEVKDDNGDDEKSEDEDEKSPAPIYISTKLSNSSYNKKITSKYLDKYLKKQ